MPDEIGRESSSFDPAMVPLGDRPGARTFRVLETIFREAVLALRPDRLLAEGGWLDGLPRAVDSYRAVRAVAVGKAGIPFAVALESELGKRLSDGLTVVPHGYPARRPPGLRLPERFRVLEAGHPVSDAAGVAASEEVLAIARAAGEQDLVIACISGGGSALLPAPPAGITLGDIRRVQDLLIRCGAPIDRVNTVRRALSNIAGGRLAEAAAPAHVLGLVLSDVPGDDPSTVASGPLSRAQTTADDALDVLREFGIQAPAPIVAFLESGGIPRPSALRADVRTVGRNADLLRAVAASARRRGLSPRIHDHVLSGEARTVGSELAWRVVDSGSDGPVLHIWGGETTVRVTGKGTGGRSQELALAAAIALDEADGGVEVTVLAAGSDGIDGPTDAAGAICDARTVSIAAERGVSARECLADNDSNRFFRGTGDLLVTGPTHTNVMDVVLVLAG